MALLTGQPKPQRGSLRLSHTISGRGQYRNAVASGRCVHPTPLLVRWTRRYRVAVLTRPKTVSVLHCTAV